MSFWLVIPIVLLMGATLLVLVAGVVVMAFGGKINQRFSNALMIARVVLQGSVIVLLLLMFFAH